MAVRVERWAALFGLVALAACYGQPGQHPLSIEIEVAGEPGPKRHPGPRDRPSLLAPDPALPFELPPLEAEVETYELVLTEHSLATIAADLREHPEQPAVLRVRGEELPARARIRGNSSRLWPKKSWRIELTGGGELDGRKKLNLLSEWKDTTLMVERLGYDLLAAMHVPAPRGRYVKLYVNGRYQGLFLDLENPDKRWARANRYQDDDPSIYRCGGKNCEFKTWLADYQKDWEKKNNEDEDDEDLRALERAINETSDPDLEAELERRFELELYLRTITMEALISNYVVEDSASFLFLDGWTGKFSYVIWDLNNSSTRLGPSKDLGKSPQVDHPLFLFGLRDSWVEKRYRQRVEDNHMDRDWAPIFSNLVTRIDAHPRLRARALDLLDRALAELFRPEALGPRVDAMYELLAPHTQEPIDLVLPPEPDWDEDPRPFLPDHFARGPSWLKEYVEGRREFLLSELARLRQPTPGLALASVDPAAGVIELENRGAAPVDLTGKLVTANLRDTSRRNLPARVLAPGARLRLDAAELGLELGATGELGLFDGESVVGALDVVFYGALPPGGRLVRTAEEPPSWEVR